MVIPFFIGIKTPKCNYNPVLCKKNGLLSHNLNKLRNKENTPLGILRQQEGEMLRNLTKVKEYYLKIVGFNT